MAAGVVSNDGVVRCGCGKRVGEINADGVEFYCTKCKVPVEVRFNEIKLNGLVQIGATLNSIANSCASLAGLIAQMQATS